VNCGDTIYVRDLWGSNERRFIAQCHGRFLVIAPTDHTNGFMLQDWRAVARELVALAVPVALTEKTRTVECHTDGGYVSAQLTYPLSMRLIADLVGAPLEQVSELLADLIVGVSQLCRGATRSGTGPTPGPST
jgi:hypothetical protein